VPPRRRQELTLNKVAASTWLTTLNMVAASTWLTTLNMVAASTWLTTLNKVAASTWLTTDRRPRTLQILCGRRPRRCKGGGGRRFCGAEAADVAANVGKTDVGRAARVAAFEQDKCGRSPSITSQRRGRRAGLGLVEPSGLGLVK
jgi:hypothetical protein